MHKMISSKILEGMTSLYIPVIASTESSTATDDWYYHIIVKPGGTIKQIHNEINNSMDSIQEMYGADTK